MLAPRRRQCITAELPRRSHGWKAVTVENGADRLRDILVEMACVLQADPHGGRSDGITRMARRLEDAGTDQDLRQRAVRGILGLYSQGMGGFQDVVLMRDGKVLPEQRRLDDLQRELFEESKRQLAGEPL